MSTISLRSIKRRTSPLVLLGIVLAFWLESLWHIRSQGSRSPSIPLDQPFHRGCVEPDVNAPREKATFLMLARNEDLKDIKLTLASLDDRFNKWFKYPILFLNDKPWEKRVVEEIRAMSAAEVRFETVNRELWGYPDSVDQTFAKAKMKELAKNGVLYADKESYHHMCRFYSGTFYDHPALKDYRYFWRIEPDVSFTCSITYDPFRAMREHGKKYGYAIALWERGETSPSLFRAVADYKASRRIKTNGIWRSMVEPSTAPWPIRKFISWILNHRTTQGDAWNQCHFWSNFEIADLNFFRTKEYRDFFEYLDRLGGFYYERWGDAPVHSLAAALFLEPHELHRFEDFGYGHDPFWTCPHNARDRQLPGSAKLGQASWSREHDDGVGCRCSCPSEESTANFPDYCFKRVDAILRPNS